MPVISASGTNVHVVWIDERDGNPEVYYKRSTDEGVNWGTDTRLTNNIYYSSLPSISVSGTNLHIAWEDKRDGGNAEIYYKSSTDGGINWGTDTRLTNNPANSESPSIAVSGSIVHIVWFDERDGNTEIYNKRSTNGGVNWGTDTRLTNSIQYSAFPFVAVSGTIVHVVWEDTRDADYEIYYKRDPTGNPNKIENISTEAPSSYSLEQNYPNPFNPNTIIRFQIKDSRFTTLKIYNILGKEVSVLVNENLKAGVYEVTFNGSALASGVYFYQLRTNNFSQTKKFILLK
ncbi:MAG: T9SS type A sorting domain-containing protein [Ignavibacteriae bacterium]|nr:T9SS type A sorting domain-containing protein [Ignavibacteriota bacterium]